MPDQDDVPIGVSAILHQGLYEGDKALADVDKALPAGHPAVEILVDEPVILDLAVQRPAGRVGRPFVEAYAPFAQRHAGLQWGL